MSDLPDTVDVAIIGSGIGGSTIAYGLAGSGARIAILERGFHLGAHPAARDARAIFQRGVFRPVETWLDPHATLQLPTASSSCLNGYPQR